MVTFLTHLNVTIKHLTRYMQKVVLAAMCAYQHGGQYKNHTTLLKNQSTIKYIPYMRFLSNAGCKIIFMCSVNFWHQQDYNSTQGKHWSHDLLVQEAYW